MDWYKALIVTLFVTSFILIGLTAATLVKTVKGTKYTFALILMTLLLAGNVAIFLSCILSVFEIRAEI